jgi:hypothetical protein
MPLPSEGEGSEVVRCPLSPALQSCICGALKALGPGIGEDLFNVGLAAFVGALIGVTEEDLPGDVLVNAGIEFVSSDTDEFSAWKSFRWLFL